MQKHYAGCDVLVVLARRAGRLLHCLGAGLILHSHRLAHYGGASAAGPLGGDTYHMHPEAVRYDEGRKNEIAAVADWHILRFTTRNIEEEMPQTMRLIKTKIDRLGGLHYAQEAIARHISTASAQLKLLGPAADEATT